MAKGELRVKIENIGETESFGPNGFKKRILEGKIEGEYPEYFQFEFVKDKVNMLDDLIEGTYATVSFNIRGRKIEVNKDGVPYDSPLFIVSLIGWKVTV